MSKETDSDARGALAEGLSAVAARMEPNRATKAADVLLAAMSKETHPVARERLARPLSPVLTGTDFKDRIRHTTSLATAFTTPHNLLPSLPLLHPHFQPQPPPLPPQSLVDLLKHPFCVGAARRAVLDALEFTYKRPFKDQWEFVEYVKANNVHDHTTGKPIDLLSPPKRPEARP